MSFSIIPAKSITQANATSSYARALKAEFSEFESSHGAKGADFQAARNVPARALGKMLPASARRAFDEMRAIGASGYPLVKTLEFQGQRLFMVTGPQSKAHPTMVTKFFDVAGTQVLTYQHLARR
jgi:hypothetical protein